MKPLFSVLSLNLLIGGLSALPVGLWAQPAPTPVEGIVLSEAQWVSVQSRFESDITLLLAWLKDYQQRKAVLASSIVDLQNKTAQLRSETRSESNVFKEIRLKEDLNELKDKLEENSKADREADAHQREFEQKCLSLIDLYNGRIVALLGEGDINPSGAVVDAKLNQVADLARKRNRIQNLLAQNRRKDSVDKPVSVDAKATLRTNDRETLQLTLDLFRDRQKNLKDQMEKWSLEMDGIKNELKLQGEMKDFLKDIQTMNTDANFPQGDLKQEDLEFLSADTHKKKLAARLYEVQQQVLQAQKTLIQIDVLTAKVQDRLNVLNEAKRP